MGSGKFLLNDGNSRLFTSLEPFGSAVLENYCLINAEEEEEDSQTPIQTFASENFSFSCKQNWEFAILRDEREVNLLGMFPSPASACTKDRKRFNQRRLYALTRRPRISVFLPFTRTEKSPSFKSHSFSLFSDPKNLKPGTKELEKYASKPFRAHLVECAADEWMITGERGKIKFSSFVGASRNYFLIIELLFCARLVLLLLLKALSIIVHGMKSFFSVLCHEFSPNAFSPLSPKLWFVVTVFGTVFGSDVYLRKWYSFGWPQSAMWMMTKQ